MSDLTTKVRKQISRAMEDVRGLDAKYPNEEDSKDLADTLNGILDDTLNKVLITTGHECWKYKGEACTSGCKSLCRNSC